ncbi:glycerate kinase [Arthrobacter sp. UYCu723]
MTILVAPDSFKGTFTAAEVSAHIAAGIRSAGGTAVELPVADGGEGTFEVLVRGLGRPAAEDQHCGAVGRRRRGCDRPDRRRHRRRRAGLCQRA